MVGHRLQKRALKARKRVRHVAREGWIERKERDNQEQHQPPCPPRCLQDQKEEYDRDILRRFRGCIFPPLRQVLLRGLRQIARGRDGSGKQHPVQRCRLPPLAAAGLKDQERQRQEHPPEDIQIPPVDQHDPEKLKVEQLVHHQHQRQHRGDHHDPTCHPRDPLCRGGTVNRHLLELRLRGARCIGIGHKNAFILGGTGR